MKQLFMTLMMIALLAASFTSSQASDRSVEGLIIGGGTGAIVGHAVGHNTQSTIAGAMVGGTVGVIIGSTMDNHYREVRHHSRRVFSHPGAKYRPHRPKVYREIIHHYDYRGPVYKHKHKRKKLHRKSRHVFSNHYKNGRRHHSRHPRKNRHYDRF